MIFLLVVLFIIINCKEVNIIKNPSFEELDSKNKLTHWIVNDITDISSTCHSGKNSLHWKQINKRIVNIQYIELEKNYQYQVCVHYKLNNIIENGFRFYIENQNYTPGYYDPHKSKIYNGTNDWKQACINTGKIKRPNGILDQYFFGVYTYESNHSNGEVFVDDISIYKINNFLRITINNDRDEVYENVNIVYEIDTSKGYKLSDWNLITRIKDNNKNIHETKIDNINSSFFTIPININKLNLKNNQFYEIEALLESKKDDIIDKETYTFKKINKIERKVTFDEYGRMYINKELFFPFGIYVNRVSENDLIQLNRTHLNFILPYAPITIDDINMIDRTQNGKIKIIYSIKDIFKINSTTCEVLNEEEDYKEYINKINILKDHPLLIGWYINDEIPDCFNKNLRNRTLTIHDIDPNHPSFSVLCVVSEVNQLLNTTDIMGFDVYPIGFPGKDIRNVYDDQNETYNEILKSKPMWPVVQIFDWFRYRDYLGWETYPPTLQEMRSMSWQGFVAGGKGMIFFSLFDLFIMNNTINHTQPFEERFRDVIEFTDQIWKYKDIILSVEKINEIKYKNNNNIVFKQWKYNDYNYLVIVNLERINEIFEIDLLNEYEVIKEFGLGNFKQNKNNIIVYLEPIDVFMIKYKLDKLDNSHSSFLIIIIVLIILIAIAILTLFIVRRYFKKRENKETGLGAILNE